MGYGICGIWDFQSINDVMKDEMLRRTKDIALKIIIFCDELPPDKKLFNIQKQLIRSASSVGANYRVVKRAKSTSDFIHKLTIVEEEADETLFWLELLSELYPNPEKITPLYKEMEEILSIVVASIKTAKRNQHQK